MRYESLHANLLYYGVPVIEIDGWQTRGSEIFNPRGSVNHHTVGPRQGTAPSLGTCINGRGGASPVPGPLCNVMGGRDLVARLIAAGRANHAGKGGVRGLSGNSSVFGLEMEHTGIVATEPVTDDMIEFMARIHAAFCKTGGFGAELVVQHWEWTTRKIDFVKGTLDPDEFRDLVATIIRRGAPPIKPPVQTPEQIEEQELMTAKADIISSIEAALPTVVRVKKTPDAGNQGDRVYCLSAAGKWWVENDDTLDFLYASNLVRFDEGAKPKVVEWKQIRKIPLHPNSQR